MPALVPLGRSFSPEECDEIQPVATPTRPACRFHGADRRSRRSADARGSASPRTPTCSTRRSRAPSSAASCSRRCATSCSTSTRSSTIVPQLATGYEWSADSKALTMKLRPNVTFHDGEKLDAAAVKFNIERHKTMPGSNRRGELAPVASVDVVDPMTVRLNLSAPFSPLLAQLADRAGMMVSPKAAQAAGDKFGAKPVCSGPFKFVERVAQDRIVLERYADYWNKGQIHVDRIVYLPIVDATVRLANLQVRPARLHRAHGAPPTCRRFKLGQPLQDRARSPRSATRASRSTSARATWRRRTALGKDARVREAFELALDRDGHRAGGDGRRGDGRQPVGRAGQPVLREEPAGARSATWRGRRRCCRRPACRTRASR